MVIYYETSFYWAWIKLLNSLKLIQYFSFVIYHDLRGLIILRIKSISQFNLDCSLRKSNLKNYSYKTNTSQINELFLINYFDDFVWKQVWVIRICIYSWNIWDVVSDYLPAIPVVFSTGLSQSSPFQSGVHWQTAWLTALR